MPSYAKAGGLPQVDVNERLKQSCVLAAAGTGVCRIDGINQVLLGHHWM